MTAPLFPPDPRSIRRLSWFLILLGLALTVGMIVVTLNMVATVNAPAGSAGSRWTGDYALTVQMFAIFGAVILLGVVTVLNGLWLLRQGAFNRVLRASALVIAAAMLADVVLVILMYSDS